MTRMLSITTKVIRILIVNEGETIAKRCWPNEGKIKYFMYLLQRGFVALVSVTEYLRSTACVRL